jgi:Arc/MetJ family transcription regulator
VHIHLCGIVCGVATNLELDDRLIDEAVKIGGKATKKAAVTEALQEYIARRKQARVLDLFGTVDYDPAYNYKTQRKRR